MSERRERPRDLLAAATRSRIVREARAVFGEKGFEAAMLSEIAKAAAVTTGAIYHHFIDKKGLFLVVAESVEQEILDTTGRASATGAGRWERFMAGIEAMLEVCAAPDVQRIVFFDAPTVIGPVEWREIELRYASGTMHRALERLMETGIIRQGSPDLLASILLGALIEATRGIARAEDQATAAIEAREIVMRLLLALRTA